jgi:hypothetical protein
MTNPTEIAVRTYAAAWEEPDREMRARLIEACFAEDGRLVSGGAELRGRAALAAAIDKFRADPRGLSARIASAIDAKGSIFRFRSILLLRDGSTLTEAFDAGLVDADGRIVLLLTFGGPLAEADAGQEPPVSA